VIAKLRPSYKFIGDSVLQRHMERRATQRRRLRREAA
jgi:hypothetical protein